MTDPQPSQQAEVPTPERSSDEPHRPVRSQAPSGPPPLDSPRPWRTEGLPKESKDQNGKKAPKKSRLWQFWVIAGIALLGLWGLLTWQDASNAPPTIPYTEFISQVEAGNVKEIYAQGDTIQGELTNEAKLPDDGDDSTEEGNYTQFTTERPTFAQDNLLSDLQAHGAVVRATPVVEQRGAVANLISSLVLWGLLIGVSIWAFRKIAKAGGGLGGFGMQREVKPIEKTAVRVNFSDVAGIDEVKEQVDEIVDFLKSPDKYRKVGARAPRGVLLEGQPGTGKTLLARATAGEADVPFFSASASEFIEMIVGVGAQRVRQLFDEAKKVAPAIVFIDEIDAIGRARGSSRASGSNDEREQTLNQILTEMDGFDGTEGVVVMAATNRSDVLDPALTRPGRFDRVITVSPPDQIGREKILKVHTRQIPLATDVNLKALAQTTPGATGADLANLANEAALRAARRNDTLVYQADFTNALEQIQLGVARSAFFPALPLSASAGYRASSLASLISAPNLVWSLGPQLALALFDNGARTAAVAGALANVDLAAATYRGVVITALQEVEDALSTGAFVQQQAQAQQLAVAAAQRALAVAQNQYRAGIVGYLNVLSAQASLLAGQRSLIELQRQQLVAVNTLLKNLGGGWTDAP